MRSNVVTLDEAVNIVRDRVTYHAKRETRFLICQGLELRTKNDVESIRQPWRAGANSIGANGAVVVNYHSFEIHENVIDDYSRARRIPVGALLRPQLPLHDQRPPAYEAR